MDKREDEAIGLRIRTVQRSLGLVVKYNHESKMVTIPTGCKVDTAIDWYGPCKMDELYGMY